VSSFRKFPKLDRGFENWIVHPKTGRLAALSSEERKSDGKTLFEDPYSCNSLGDILYLESSAGVGYSYQENNDLKTDDIQTVKDNYLAPKNFFEKFPHLKNNSFYITGESNARIYIPMLALEIRSKIVL
jgi:carboxypeptidase C (cathepsin A)